MQNFVFYIFVIVSFFVQVVPKKIYTFFQKTLFSYNYLRTALLGGAMRTFREKRDCLLTPSGEDVYPKDVHLLFKKSPGILNRICCEIVGRLIELKVTNEEYLLLILIFFCNPGESLQLFAG